MQRCQELQAQPCDRLLLALPDPTEFLASFWAAITTHTPVFLGNPHWREPQWQTVSQQIQPQRVWGEVPCALCADPEPKPLGQIMIPTGGTSGQIRWAMHTLETLAAAVEGFQTFFDVEMVNSFCILPLYHVSGLMQFWRSLLTGGICTLGSYTDLKQGHWSQLPNPTGFLSLVPTQLQRLLGQGGAAWLRQFEVILLGGAPAWPELLNRARHEGIRLAPTYGMTETAAQVVTLRPTDFLAGNRSTGQVLPHAQVRINEQGGIEIQARSLCLGYYPQPFPVQTSWPTDDLGKLDAEGYLTITGRQSRKIITGGENVFPEAIEALLHNTGLVKDVCVVGVPDAYWGEAIAAVYSPQPHCDLAQLQAALKAQCNPVMQPRHWLMCEVLPRSPQGKIQHDRVRAWAIEKLASRNP